VTITKFSTNPIIRSFHTPQSCFLPSNPGF